MFQLVTKDMVARKMKGSVVNVSSVASDMCIQQHTVYCELATLFMFS